MSEEASLINQIEALVFSSSVPISAEKIVKQLEAEKPSIGKVRSCLETLQKHYEYRGVQLVEVASGWRFQVALECASTIVKTFEEKPTRLSRALLETLALIAYRQPITRGEIESIRGVVVSSQMVKTLLEHEWIRVVGHKDVPGKPALYATTKTFLDDMGLQKLDELPPLSELKALLPNSEESEIDSLTSTEAVSDDEQVTVVHAELPPLASKDADANDSDQELELTQTIVLQGELETTPEDKTTMMDLDDFSEVVLSNPHTHATTDELAEVDTQPNDSDEDEDNHAYDQESTA